jgi:hypothetical protein
MQIDAKGIEYLVMIMVLKKLKLKYTIWKDTFPFFFIWESNEQILI